MASQRQISREGHRLLWEYLEATLVIQVDPGTENPSGQASNGESMNGGSESGIRPNASSEDGGTPVETPAGTGAGNTGTGTGGESLNGRSQSALSPNASVAPRMKGLQLER